MSMCQNAHDSYPYDVVVLVGVMLIHLTVLDDGCNKVLHQLDMYAPLFCTVQLRSLSTQHDCEGEKITLYPPHLGSLL